MIKTARLFAFGAVAGAAALLSAAPAAKAQNSVTIGQYNQTRVSDQFFTLVNNKITARDNSVTFTYDGGVVLNAFLNFDAITPDQAIPTTVGTDTRLSERFASYTFSITSGAFNTGTGTGTGTNYLSGFGSNLILNGKQGGNQASAGVSTPPDSDVVFTSDVINTTSIARNFTISLSSVNPVLNTNSDGYISDFTASSTGTFAKTTPNAVPEPGMVTFALTSGAGLAGMVLRGRRKFKKAA